MIDIMRLPHATASRVYAVGDVHGRLDLLLTLEALIAADLAASPTPQPVICYLGDYIDRGPASAQVLDHLAGGAADGIARAFLKGNHEDRMIDFLVDPARHGPGWLTYGGREALESYGLAVPEMMGAQDWPALRDALDAALPARQRAFLDRLLVGLRWRDYLFVHAGLNPARPTSAQDPHDMMWIREPFLASDQDWGAKVVHGHVIADAPVFRTNRIGIDTGAYRTGRLTCLVLDGQSERLLQT